MTRGIDEPDQRGRTGLHLTGRDLDRNPRVRVRDVTLSYIRGLTFEQIASNDATEKMRKELLEKWQAVGATDAQQVLITDLITQ